MFVLATQVAAQTFPADDHKTKARASYELAERAAADLRFSEALAAYDKAIELDPSAPFVRVARARAADLRAHAEGDFAPLTRLEGVRRNPRASRDDIEALARDAERFPSGRVRSEAQIVVAEAFWHRFGSPDLAARALDAALSDASADRLTRALALSELVTLERERGDLDAAKRVVSRFPDLAPNLRAEVERLVRRVWIGRVAIAIVGFFLVIGVAAVVRALSWQRRDPDEVLRKVVRASSVAFALYVGGAASLLVRLHGEGDVRPFLWLGFGVLAIDLAARGWRLGFVDERRSVRIGRAFAGGIAVLAVAFLSLQYADAAYLESLGL
jgi:tetratricopeptide (TPR) repeat protein